MIPERLIYKNKAVYFLDQRLLPDKICYVKTETAEETAKAIKDMVLRGAPLIGCAAAYGFVLAFEKTPASKKEIRLKTLKTVKLITSARPTAVALFSISERMAKKISETLEIFPNERISQKEISFLKKTVLEEAEKTVKEDYDSTLAMARFGLKLFKPDSKVVTYCNTGALATMGIGTALGVITEGFKKGRIKHAYACETRPYMQGARLTIWELQRNGVPASLITDNMAAHLMKTEKIDAAIIGADRIASNGDTANKIGSYSLAINAAYHKIPFYVAAPVPTFDLKIKSGEEIIIEERPQEEVTVIKGLRIAPEGVKARHPAFDVTPAGLIRAIITENGVISPVNAKNILRNIRKSA